MSEKVPEAIHRAFVEHRGGLFEGGRSNTRHREHCFLAGWRAAQAEAQQHGYAHMCRDGHVQIGHNDNSSELCPLCRERAARQELLAAIRTVNELHDLGDAVYSVRERAYDKKPFERNSWHHPRVERYAQAYRVIERHLKQ